MKPPVRSKYDPEGVLTRKEKMRIKKALHAAPIEEPFKSRREWMKEQLNDLDEQTIREGFRGFFQTDFENDLNVFKMLIDMMKVIPDKQLSSWYLEEFQKWLTDSNQENQLRERFLTPDVKSAALSCIADRHKKLISEIFHISKESLMEETRKQFQTHLAKKDFVSAASLAEQLNLSIGFEELILPLVLIGKEEVAFKLLVGKVELQRKLVEFLDDLVAIDEFSLMEKLDKFKDLNIANLERYKRISIDRFIKIVLEQQDFDENLIDYAPNREANRRFKELKYHIMERYEKGGSDEQYFQHMQLLVNTSPKVREEILHWLWKSGKEEKRIDAISWAIFLQINHSGSNQLPGLMKDFFRSPDDRLQDAMKLLEERKKLYVPLRNEQMFVKYEDEMYPIHMAKTEEDLSLLTSQLKHLESDSDPIYLGFDSEWASNDIKDSGKADLLQFYFQKTVWLVDCVELSGNVKEETWRKFATRIFKSEKIKVIGFDLRNDLDAILAIPALKYTLKIEDIRNTWCVKRLTENVCDIDMSILGLEKKTFKLADLTQKLLGIELDKTEQRSVWNFRPLRLSQIEYAARDSVVVVETFKKILELATPRLELEKLMNESNVMAPKKERDKGFNRKFHTIPWVELFETLDSHRDPSKQLQKPHEVKVIVDNTLIGFGRNLRRIGIDVLICGDQKNVEFYEKLSIMNRLGGSYQRQIITFPSKTFEKLQLEYARHTICLPMLNSKPPVEQVTAFLDEVNLDLSSKVDFSRCTECNSRHIVKFPGPVIHFLHQYRVIYQQQAYVSMADFPMEDWWHRMHHINPSDYDDIQVEMSRPSPSSNWIVATVPTGCLHVTRNTVLHNNVPCGVEVRIHKVPDDEFKRHGLCFFICGDCGTVHYDGRAQYASH